jgi:hypothetical protein
VSEGGARHERLDGTETLHHAEGRAALALVECLLMTLLDTRVLTREQLVEAVESAVEANRQSADDDHHQAVSQAAAGLLRSIGGSMAVVVRKP